MAATNLLIIGHDESLCRILSERADGIRVTRVSPDEPERLVGDEPWSCVLCDLSFASADDWAFLIRCRDDLSLPVLVSGPNDSEVELRAIEAGAIEYLPTPLAASELLHVLRRREAHSVAQRKREDRLRSSDRSTGIIVQSEGMKRVFETVTRLANFATTVLIVGESGTGKELVARELHLRSPRRGRPFVAINCGAIPENLMESELFGHKRGAFTDASRDKKGLFEEADGGTLFLDEIGELPLHLQVKILRALQEHQIRRVGDEQVIGVDVRVVAATLRNLEDDVREGRFRDDLYYRLNVVSIEIPPLRERREEIPVLIQHFIKKHNKRLGLKVRRVTPAALETLTSYRWRGNVRELENCVERAMVLTDGDVVDCDALPDHIREAGATEQYKSRGISLTDDNLSIKQKARDLEVNLIRRALERTNGNRTHAAKVLEISHRALLYKLKEYGLADL